MQLNTKNVDLFPWSSESVPECKIDVAPHHNLKVICIGLCLDVDLQQHSRDRVSIADA